MKKTNTKTIVMIGMFAAILAVLSQISIPMPSGVPVTLQTFAVALTGFILGWKYGAIATGIYILLGAVGVPVFSNFSGGLGALFGKTGGFIWGFLFLAGLCGISQITKKKIIIGISSIAGLFICHLLGIIQFQIVAEMGFWKSALLVSVPYLLKDMISIFLAYVAGQIVLKNLRAANIYLWKKQA